MKIFERIIQWWKHRRQPKVEASRRISDQEMMEEAVWRAYRSKQIVVANRKDDGSVEFSDDRKPDKSCKRCRPK